jgi:hypothetical protein
MSTAATLAAGALVLYHGSHRWMHGEWQIAGPCACGCDHPDCWELADIWERDHMTCVRRESFTPYPQEPAPDGHKTRTSLPSGYACDAIGARRSDKRGRLMHDRGSFWYCTCGEGGAGADRAEARGWARQHREQEAARERAEYEAGLAGLRAKLESLAA